MKLLLNYMNEKGLPNLDDIADENLPDLLEESYSNAHTKNSELCNTTSMKSIRSNINRWFKEKRKIDIISDACFVQSNSMFKAMQVRAKIEGRGVCKHTKFISDEDMKKTGTYFNNFMTNPNPALLQEPVLFHIIYFFCRHGKENLHEMTKNTFKVCIENGTHFLRQDKDELDKNHWEDSRFS